MITGWAHGPPSDPSPAKFQPKAQISHFFFEAFPYTLVMYISACPVATRLFKATLDTIPGAFCLLNAGVLTLLAIVYLAAFIVITVFRVPISNNQG